MPSILIVAYGNPLRSDDGVAWRAADALEVQFSARDVEILRFHQLVPEVAPKIGDRELVLFIDAECGETIGEAGQVRVREILHDRDLGASRSRFSHVFSPTKVLALARDLYGARAKAFVITVAGENFGHGDCLSSSVAQALPVLVGQVERLVEESANVAN